MGLVKNNKVSKLVLLVWTMIGIIYGYQLYNNDDFVCCNGQIYNRTNNSMDFDCYGKNLCNFRTHRCCGNETLKIQEAEDYRCCSTDYFYNDVFFNYRAQICCNGQVIDLPFSNNSDILYNCCENQIYNSLTNTCCQGKVIQKEEGKDCCGEVKFNTSTEICCKQSNWMNKSSLSVNVIPFDPLKPFCCGLQTYNYQNEICCQNKAWPLPRGYKKYSSYNRAQCCGDQLLYDHNQTLCCRGNVVRKPSHHFHCCGKNVYNYRYQSCCGNEIFDIPPRKHIKCCRKSKQLYDDRTQVCCDQSVVVNITDEDIAANRVYCC